MTELRHVSSLPNPARQERSLFENSSSLTERILSRCCTQVPRPGAAQRVLPCRRRARAARCGTRRAAAAGRAQPPALGSIDGGDGARRGPAAPCAGQDGEHPEQDWGSSSCPGSSCLRSACRYSGYRAHGNKESSQEYHSKRKKDSLPMEKNKFT